MPDQDGYPTEMELAIIRAWDDSKDPLGWLEYARSLWFYTEWGWPSLDGEVSTGGWSGNERIIDAMKDNEPLWKLVFVSARRGGHYIFSIPPEWRIRKQEPF